MMSPLLELLEPRPAEIILAYWKEQIVIEEDADLLEPVRLEVAA